ncbi:hypothetical protein HZB94_02395 [Candidatus Falkowbacteria bacterium]|nr:hypothetical protein [Candidatus Falkowbacteria bacterium]
MSSLCEQIKTEYEQLQTLKERLVFEYEKVKDTDDADGLSVVKKLQAEGESAYANLESKLYVSVERARELLGGENVLGPEEVEKTWGVRMEKVPEILFSEAELIECKDTHILVAICPLSILEIRDKVSGNQSLFRERNRNWYNKESFAKVRGKIEWRLVRKTPVGNSTDKTWDKQQALLTKYEETPTAQVMVYAIIGHFLATGERLFDNIYVRCSDVILRGCRVCVGFFGADGLNVAVSSVDDNAVVSIGVSASRLPSDRHA